MGATWVFYPTSTPPWATPSSSSAASSTRCAAPRASQPQQQPNPPPHSCAAPRASQPQQQPNPPLHSCAAPRASQPQQPPNRPCTRAPPLDGCLPCTVTRAALLLAQGDGGEYVGFVNREADEESKRSGRYTKDNKPDVRVTAFFRAVVSLCRCGAASPCADALRSVCTRRAHSAMPCVGCSWSGWPRIPAPTPAWGGSPLAMRSTSPSLPPLRRRRRRTMAPAPAPLPPPPRKRPG